MNKLQLITSILAVVAATEATNAHQHRHVDVVKRQTTSGSATSSAPSSTSASSTGSGNPNTDPLATLTAAVSGIPPLGAITSGMPAGTPLSASTTYTAGAKPTYSGAPALPSPCASKPPKTRTQAEFLLQFLLQSCSSLETGLLRTKCLP